MSKTKVMLFVTIAMLWHVACAGNDNRHLRIVVKGRVIDRRGQPVPGARVQARLGLDLDGDAVETAPDGSFIAEAASDFWFKGPPSVNAAAKGYSEEYVYFDRWERGERRFDQTIVLKPSPKAELTTQRSR